MIPSVSKTNKIGIIGGGVAGMSCALWLHYLGFSPVIIEQNDSLGGQLLRLNRLNRWVLGFPDKTSVELAEIYAAHINNEGIKVLYQTRLVSVTAITSGFDLQLDKAGHSFNLTFLALVIATGVRAVGDQMFGHIPGFKALYKRGLISSFPLDHLDQVTELKGKTVAVIGGGDNAHFTTKDMAFAGARVHLLIRSRHKARNSLRNEIDNYIKQGVIVEHEGVQVDAFRLTGGKLEISLVNMKGDSGQVKVDRVFIRAGFTANSEFLDNFAVFTGIAKDSGYLVTDSAKRTSIPWVYAIGDISNAKNQSVVGALADGAIAAQDLSGRI